MTQKDILENLLTEIKHIKTHMPNGELKQMQKDLSDLKVDMSDMKYTLLNPEDGVIVNTNKNTEFRLTKEAKEREYFKHIQDLEELKNWKSGVTRALWVIFGILASVIIRMLMMHSDKLQ